MIDLAKARAFIRTQARALERSVYEVLFEGGDPAAVVATLAEFSNDDGGFGHGLEPDKLVPASQALDVEVAFDRLAAVGAAETPIALAACEWLLTIAAASGAVPILLPSAFDHPRASHWVEADYPPALNPTAGIVGHAHTMGVEHPWVEQATKYCFEELEQQPCPGEGHELLAVTKFLAAVPDRTRAERIAPSIAEAIKTAAFVKYDATSDAYGVTPIHYAPTPDSFARPWFPDDIIEGHLDALAAEQEDDGGWPIAWEPPTSDSLRAWRGIRTLEALTTLHAYGRLPDS